jgi:hypothetical protein
MLFHEIDHGGWLPKFGDKSAPPQIRWLEGPSKLPQIARNVTCTIATPNTRAA